MQRSTVLTILALTLAVAASACSSSEDSDSRLTGDDADGDAGTSGSIIGADDGDGPPLEELEICEGQGAECGFVADGEGGIAACGDCPEGSACGVLELNRCTQLSEGEFCTPLPKDEACEGKQCGATGDGCGGVHQCGNCDSGDSCGLVEAFTCAPLPNDDACPAQIASCEAAGAECGVIGNGCGGTLDCDAEVGGCSGGQFCGGDGPQQCGSGECQPLEPAEACAGKCGMVSNGCGQDVDGGLIDCSALFPCPAGEACGAGGIANVCGDPEQPCEPLSSAEACADRECGAVGNGCDGSHVCGTCDSGLVCRDGQCEPPCLPLTQAEACDGKECGTVSDGCDGTLDCGACSNDEGCGVKQPFVCDPLPPGMCTPQTAEEACAGRECGLAYDGCGTEPENTIDCETVSGDCQDGEFCGILEPFQCDSPIPPDCMAASSCAELNWECGIAMDECGNMFDCALEGLSCNPDTETCLGGITEPARCDNGLEEGSGGCSLCDAIPDCSAEPQRTQLTGRVITPGQDANDTANQVGVPNAFVYILRNNDPSELPAIETGIPAGGTACDRCEEQQLGPVLASATTDALGNYTIRGDIPVGTEFVLVVKVGKFRRAVQMTLDSSAACETTVVPSSDTRLPRNMSDGLAVNIPRIAITTGEIDAMECVLFKMGLAESEFAGGQLGGTSRVHLYGHDGAGIDGGDSNPPEEDLHTDLARMMSYDMLIFDCQGFDFPDHDESDPRVREYVNRGGRMFASHLSYTWICDNGEDLTYDPADPFNTGLAASATYPGCAFDTGGGLPNPSTGVVSVGRPDANPSKIQGFADWLVNEGAASLVDGQYEFDIFDPRDLATDVGDFSDEFVYLENGESIQQYSFNTPYGAPTDAICGRVAYTGFHVSPAGSLADYDGDDFPEHCVDLAANEGTLANQEKVLLFMLFDLGTCISEQREPPPCPPVDCTGRCGEVPDGCGGVVDCPCDCTQTSCEAEAAECGLIPDGCGGQLDCGTCPAGQGCDLMTNTCVFECTPLTAGEACGDACGFVSDGCGGVVQCAECPDGLNCIEGECSAVTCMPQACPDNLECGEVSDGCDGVATCGECVEPEVCGAAGQPNMCVVPECMPLSCSAQNAECGFAGDGCGDAVDCGPCPLGQVCGALEPNQCDGCQPLDCSAVDAECGSIGDGCGGTVDCGPCPDGEVCGAGAPNQCGEGPACEPQSCGDVDAECGLIGDGCGDEVDCGPCPEGEVCGYEEPFKCAPVECEPTSCDAEGAQCGAIGDGCDDKLDCGTCSAGFICRDNQCERIGAK